MNKTYTLSEIARILGVTKKTVEAYITRGLDVKGTRLVLNSTLDGHHRVVASNDLWQWARRMCLANVGMPPSRKMERIFSRLYGRSQDNQGGFYAWNNKKGKRVDPND